jgi:uncharacterized damage-inducible protein DinB
MDKDQLARQILATWHRHNQILLYLLDQVPEAGLKALPAGSRGRTVAAQFAHLDRVRMGWIHYHLKGKRPRLPRFDKEDPPSRAQLRKALKQSGGLVEEFLKDGLRGEVKPRLFGGQVVRWMGYLVAHESHHRGQIMLALKQSGMKLPDKVAVGGLWEKWCYGP